MADTKLSALGAVTAATLADLAYLVQSSTSYQIALKNLLAMLPVVPGGRLTLTTGVPVTTADVIGATTLYWTPYLHGGIQLWDGAQWQAVTPGEVSLALGTLTSEKPYDVFGFLSGGTLALELLVWTSDTARATAVTFQDGRLCKSGDKTRLLLGSLYTTATTTTEDSAAKRYLSNLYNRVRRAMRGAVESTNSWTYSTAAYRQANANVANQLEYLETWAVDVVEADVLAFAAAGGAVGAGIGVDSTTVNAAQVSGAQAWGSTPNPITARYVGVPGVGRHALVWLENGAGVATAWYGDNNVAFLQAGILGVGMA